MQDLTVLFTYLKIFIQYEQKIKQIPEQDKD